MEVKRWAEDQDLLDPLALRRDCSFCVIADIGSFRTDPIDSVGASDVNPNMRDRYHRRISESGEIERCTTSRSAKRNTLPIT